MPTDNQVVYLSFLDIQPAPPVPTWRLRVQSDTLSVSLPCPAPHQPRDGVILPALLSWPLMVSIDTSVPVLVDKADSTQQIGLVVDSIEYTVRILIACTPSAAPAVPSEQYIDVVAIANSPDAVQLLDSVPQLDLHAHALATFMSLDKTIIYLSKLVMAETSPSRVPTTSECRDLLYPVSPVAAFTRSLCRTYLTNEIIASISPILVELCEEAVTLSTRSLADQTTFASLAVRLTTAAIDIVTTRLPIPFVIAVEEAFRLNIPSVPTGPLVGAFLTANLISASVAFPDDFQIPLTIDSLPLLTRVHSAVVQALIASVDSQVDLTGDLATLVHGLGMDIRSKATAGFNALVARCHLGASSFPAIERVSDSRILDAAAAVLRNIKLPPRDSIIDPTSLPTPIRPEGAFLALLEDFKARAFSRESKIDQPIHHFHQYHLHHYSHGTHFNPQGPVLDDNKRSSSRPRK